MMTPLERRAKEKIINLLRREGRATYARLFMEFDFNFTKNPNVVAYMSPNEGKIVCNTGLDIDQVSTVIRHEILHNFLQHHERLIAHVAKKSGIDIDNMSVEEREQIIQKIYSNKNFNIAGDYEISNRGYTDADKSNVRKIKLNDQILSGLVTEDDHPDWTDLSIEEMYDKLEEISKKEQEQMKDDVDKNNQKNQQQQSNQQDGDNENNSDDSDSSDDEEEQPIVTIYGSFQPDGTFVDRNGNVIGG